MSGVADEVGISKNNARAVMSNLKEKIEFNVKRDDNNRKLYELPDSVESDLFGLT
nr:MAG: hypothetical protein J07AB56_00140 [Candidatus Nanosalinarum sp. J07AB56]